MMANYAIKPSADQALRPNEIIVPRRLIAALEIWNRLCAGLTPIVALRGEVTVKTAVLTMVVAIALGGCFTTGEVKERELMGGADEISNVCGPKSQLLNEEASSLVFVQIVNEKYAFYYRGNSEGMKEINCAFPFESGELEAWLTVNKVQYGKYVIDTR